MLSGLDGGSEFDVSVVVHELDVGDVDSVHLWDHDSSGQFVVGVSNPVVEEGVEVGLEGGRVHGGSGEDGGGGNLSEVDVSGDLSGGGSNDSGSFNSLKVGLDGFGSVGLDVDVEVELGVSTTVSGEVSDTSLVDQSTSDLDGGSLSVDILEFWDDEGENVSIDGHVEVLLEELGDIEGVSSVESRGVERVDEVLGDVELEILSSGVSKLEGGWGKVWVEAHVRGVEPGSVNVHLQVGGVGGNDWSVDLRVVNSESTEAWDWLLNTVLGQVLVGSGVNDGLELVLNSRDDFWEDSRLQESDEGRGNLVNSTSGELDGDVVWVDLEGNGLAGEVWSHFSSEGGDVLGGEVHGGVEAGVSHGDVHLSGDGGEEDLVGEVSSDVGANTGGGKSNGVLGSTEGDVDLAQVGWGGGGGDNVGEGESVSGVVWDLDVLGLGEKKWNNDVLGVGDSSLGERHTKTSLHVRGSRDSSNGGEGEQLVHFSF